LDRGLALAKKNNPSAVSPAFGAMERQRLAALLAEFLEMEKMRAPFDVVACEEPRVAELGGLQLKVRIDRIDELAGGRRVILDYKTGKVSTSGWWDERLDEPQLPLYAITDAGEVTAWCFRITRWRELAGVSWYLAQVLGSSGSRILGGECRGGSEKISKHLPVLPYRPPVPRQGSIGYRRR
jgi:ATP-dependent helicase/nuclease subunit B